MKTVSGIFGALLLVLSAAGCQCCGVTERYADLIDDVSDCKPTLDRFYHAELDLNRIGKPDWCRSRINRALCPCRCVETCGCGHHPCGGGECRCPAPCLCGEPVEQAPAGTPPMQPGTAPPAPQPASPPAETDTVPYLLPAGD